MRKGRNTINLLKKEDGMWLCDEKEILDCFLKNDALFSFEASPESCYELRNTLEDFCAIPGEMINYKKSHVQFSRNTPPKFVRYMRKPLGVRSQKKMGTYLGCPMEVDRRNTSTFNQIHDRVLQCISSWKYSCLNPAARSILINSILVALAAHIMSIYLLPQKGLKRIDSTIIKFYWGGNNQTKPIYWKSRDTLELRKEEGGLGLRNLTSLNQALLFRQTSRAIRHRYGGDPLAIARHEAKIRNASWAMRSMVNCAKVLKSGCGMKVGNGRSTPIRSKFGRGRNRLPLEIGLLETSWRSPRTQPKGFYPHISQTKRKRIRSYDYRKRMEITRVKLGYWYSQSQRKTDCTNSKFWKRLWKMLMSQSHVFSVEKTNQLAICFCIVKSPREFGAARAWE
ncbi:hypothetical protein RDABS01_006277 [Bienertia sinuspersici]